MDTLTINYQNIIEEIFNEYVDYLGEDEQVQIELIFDTNKGHYLLTGIG